MSVSKATRFVDFDKTCFAASISWMIAEASASLSVVCSANIKPISLKIL